MRSILLFLFSHRLLAIARWDLHLLAVRARNALTDQPCRIRAFLATRQRPTFLNLGSGPRGSEDPRWVNVDAFHDRNVHFLIDFNRRLPFPSSTFDGVFSEHVLEHFSLEDGELLAREVHRVLRPGGCFRIVLPDAALLMRCYFDAPSELVAQRNAPPGTTPIEAVNLYFRQRYEHQFLYDWETLDSMLARAGFVTRVRVAVGEARFSQDIVLDDEKYAWESLYAEAVKGATGPDAAIA